MVFGYFRNQAINVGLYSFRLRSTNLLKPCYGNLTSLTFREHSPLCNFQTLGPYSSLNGKGFFRTVAQHARSNVSEQVLYTFDNTKLFTCISLFGFSVSAFWIFTAYEYISMNITPPEQKRTRNQWLDKFDLVTTERRRFWLSISTALGGCAVLSLCWFFCMRSVCKVVLNQGGKKATLFTFNPLTFRVSPNTTASLDGMTCNGHRHSSPYVTVKVQGKLFHYIISTNGVFNNGSLFDKTVGLRRAF